MGIHIERTHFASGDRLELWQATTTKSTTVDEVLGWLQENAAAIRNTVTHAGGIAIRGLTSLKTAVEFNAAISVIAPEQLDYIGGTSPRTAVLGRIMTATDLPPRYSIPLHQEMAYTATPPDKISFFCEQPAAKDGQTTITDMREILKKISPEFRERCQRHGIQLRRAMPSLRNAHLKPGVQKPWTEVFATDDPIEAEQIVASKGWRSSWVDGETMQWDPLESTCRHASLSIL